MIYLFASNCNGRGISVLTDELIDVIKDDSDLKVFYPRRNYPYLLRLCLICFDMIKLFLISNIKPGRVVILANYFPLPSRSFVVTVLRHPFILENCVSAVDRVRYITFLVTCLFADTIVVQSQFMYQTFSTEPTFKSFKNKTAILANPLRDLSPARPSPNLVAITNNIKTIYPNIGIYPSGYYEHKGFEDFILSIIVNAKKFEELGFHFLFCVTKEQKFYKVVDGCFDFGQIATKHENLFTCLGVLSPYDINHVYSIASFGIFPSFSETYGNGLYEMQSLGLSFLYRTGLPYLPVVDSAVASNFSSATILTELMNLQSNKKNIQNHNVKHLDQKGWYLNIIGLKL